MGEVQQKIARRAAAPSSAPAAPAAAAPDAAATASLKEALKDPLNPLPAAARSDLTSALTDRKRHGAEIGSAAAPVGAKLASGEKVVRTMFLTDGKIPWGTVENVAKAPVSAEVKARVDAAVAGAALDRPFVELILTGSDLQIQVEQDEMILVGPETVCEGWATKNAEDADAARAGQAVGADSSRITERLESAVRGARTVRDTLAAETKGLDSAAPPEAGGKVAGPTAAAGKVETLRATRSALASEVDELSFLAESAGSGTDGQAARAAAHRAEAMLTELDRMIEESTRFAAEAAEISANAERVLGSAAAEAE